MVGDVSGAPPAVKVQRKLQARQLLQVKKGERPSPPAQLSNVDLLSDTQAARLTHPERTLTHGSVIQAALQNAINSDLLGSVVAVVSVPVPALSEDRILIPRGYSFFGQYPSGIEMHQTRILILWTRVLTPDGKVWLEVAGDATMRHEGQTVDRTTALNMAQTIVGDAKARVSEKNPLVSGKVEYACRPLRVQVAVPPAIDHGASITIRLFASGSVRDYAPTYLFGKAVSLDALRAEKMENIATLAEESLEAALQTLVEARLNVLISGGTSTGNPLSTEMPRRRMSLLLQNALLLLASCPMTSARSSREPMADY